MTFPITEFSQLEIEQVADVRLSETRYKRSRSLGPKKEYWLISVSNPPVPYNEGMGIGAELSAYRGSYEVFSLPNPFPPLAARVGLRLNSAATKGSGTIEIKGLPANSSNAAISGDFINCVGHAKAYQIVGNVTSNGSGVGTAKINPPLFQGVAVNTAINYGEDAVFQVCLDDFISAKVDGKSGKLMSFSLELMEQG